MPPRQPEVGIQINHLGAGLPLSVIQQRGSNPLRILPTRAVNSIEAPTFPLVPLPPGRPLPLRQPQLKLPTFFSAASLRRILFSTRNVFPARLRFEWPNRHPTPLTLYLRVLLPSSVSSQFSLCPFRFFPLPALFFLPPAPHPHSAPSPRFVARVGVISAGANCKFDAPFSFLAAVLLRALWNSRLCNV